jgi:Ni,Fe-hydrogenase III large subunit
MKELESIKTHIDYLVNDKMRQHAKADRHSHSIDFQVYRLLVGYNEALESIDLVKEALKDWKNGSLSDLSAMTAISLALECEELPEGTAEYIKKKLDKKV